MEERFPLRKPKRAITSRATEEGKEGKPRSGIVQGGSSPASFSHGTNNVPIPEVGKEERKREIQRTLGRGERERKGLNRSVGNKVGKKRLLLSRKTSFYGGKVPWKEGTKGGGHNWNDARNEDLEGEREWSRSRRGA